MRLWRLTIGLVFVALTGCTPPEPVVKTPQEATWSGFRVGAASAEISPEPGAFIAGDARNRRFAGVHDPLFVKAVVVQKDAAMIAIVTVDSIGLTRPDIEVMRQRAVTYTTTVTGLSPENIIISSTHTHSGPDVVGLWGEHELSSGRDPVYMDRMTSAVATQVAAAAASMQPASMRVASGVHDLAWVQNVTEPELLDRQMGVVQFLDASSMTIATLTNFSCHPTVLDAVSDLVSADFVAGFYRLMADHLPGEHLFLQGAIGGWVQPDKTGRGFALADRYGASVAHAALTLLLDADAIEAPELRIARREFLVPLRNPGFKSLLDAGVLNRPLEDGSIRTETVAFSIGDAVFVTHPGETSPQYSLDTRALLDRHHSFVLGLTGDALGYILKPDYFDPAASYPSADYLTATSIGPEAGPLLMENIGQLTTALRQQSEGSVNADTVTD